MTLLSTEVVVPELGQVVRCRDRVWAVNEVAPSALPPDPIGGTRPQHLVRMSSIEDDGFGDELTVIWELEAGTLAVLRKTGLHEYVRLRRRAWPPW